MQFIREETFEHNNKQYQLRLVKDDDSYHVIAFLGSQQVTSGSATIETAKDYQTQNHESLVDVLFESVRTDIKSVS